MSVLLSPGWLLGIVFTTGYAGLFHLWGGRSLRDLGVYWIASILGFSAGQLVGTLLQTPLPQLGQLHIVEATAFAWFAMIGAREFIS
jgi:hypothetical protein